MKPNQQLNGQIAYEVPVAQHTYTLTFQASQSSDLLAWTLTI
jgi:hypothetical protein